MLFVDLHEYVIGDAHHRGGALPSDADMKHRFRLILVDRERRIELDGRDIGLRAPAGKGDLSFFGGLGRGEGRPLVRGAKSA